MLRLEGKYRSRVSRCTLGKSPGSIGGVFNSVFSDGVFTTNKTVVCLIVRVWKDT